MLGKIIKGFFKLGLLLFIGAMFIGWLIGAAVSYHESGELPYDNVTYMMECYEKNVEAPRGSGSHCPVCDQYYYKGDFACCSAKCEREYHDIVRAWNSANGDRKFIENHGKKFK